MKKFTIICLFLASLHARADLVMVQNVSTGDKGSDMTVMIKGGKFRSDAADKLSSVITDLNTGETVKLLHFQAVYIKYPVKQPADNAAKPPQLVDTGKQEVVNGYDTEIFTAETATQKYTYWITKNYPDFAAVNGELKKFRALENNLAGKGATFPDLSKLDGVVIRSKIVSGDKTLTTTLVSAKVQPVEDSQFQIPANYSPMPDADNAPSSPASAPAPAAQPKSTATPAKSKP